MSPMPLNQPSIPPQVVILLSYLLLAYIWRLLIFNNPMLYYISGLFKETE